MDRRQLMVKRIMVKVKPVGQNGPVWQNGLVGQDGPVWQDGLVGQDGPVGQIWQYGLVEQTCNP